MHANAPSAPTAAQRRWILAGLMATMMLAAMDTTIVATAVSHIVADLGGLALISWVFSSYLLAQTITIPLYGKCADLFGRKPVLLVGTLVFLVGSALCALAWNMPSLIAFRALQGLGAGAIMATVMTLAGDLYSVEERGVVQGWLSSVWGIAAVTGPLLGGAFAEYAHWRWIFLVNLPIGVLAVALLLRFLHENFARRPARLDIAGSTWLLLTLTLFILALLQGGQSWAWLSWPSAALLTGAALALAAFIATERRAAEPVMPGWLWRRRDLACPNLAAIGMGMAMMAPSIYLPTFLQAVHGNSAIAAGLVLAGMSVGWPLASSLAAPLYLRWGFRPIALAGIGVMGLAVLLFLRLPQPPGTAWVLLDQFLLGLGLGFFSTPVLVGMQSIVGWHQRGVVTSSQMFARFLGQSLGAALFGAIFNSSLSRALHAQGMTLELAELDRIVTLAQSSIDAKAALLRSAITSATADLYLGMLALLVCMALALVWTPRNFGCVSSKQPANEPS